MKHILFSIPRGVVLSSLILLLTASAVPGISLASPDASTSNRPDENWNVESLGSYPTTYQYPMAVIVRGHYAYVTSHTERHYTCPAFNGALDIFDITTSPPERVGRVFGNYDITEPLDLAVVGDFAYVAENNDCGWGGVDPGLYLLKLDIRNPHNPAMYERILIAAAQYDNIALSAQGDLLYVFGTGHFDILATPVSVFYEPLATLPVSFYPAFDLDVKGNYAYLMGEIYYAGRDDHGWIPTIEIVDITNPFLPVPVSLKECAASHSISVANIRDYGQFAYLATDTGLQIFDVTDPGHPSDGVNYAMPDPSVFVFTTGRNAYVSSGDAGINVLDILYPTRPLLTGYYTTNVNASALFVQGSTIIGVDDRSGLVALRFNAGNLFPAQRPTGPSTGAVGVKYEFSTVFAKTFQGDSVYFLWSWGDGALSEWLGPHTPGERVFAYHPWSAPGEYPVRVKVRDVHGLESPWSMPLIITIE